MQPVCRNCRIGSYRDRFNLCRSAIECATGLKEETHLKAMNAMQDLMQKREAMKEWFENKEKEFEALPDDLIFGPNAFYSMEIR